MNVFQYVLKIPKLRKVGPYQLISIFMGEMSFPGKSYPPLEQSICASSLQIIIASYHRVQWSFNEISFLHFTRFCAIESLCNSLSTGGLLVLFAEQ